MNPFVRMLMCLVLAVAFVGCDQQRETGEGGSGDPAAGGSKVTIPGSGGPAGGETGTPAGLPEGQEVVEAAQKQAAETTEAVKEAAEELEKASGEAATEAKETAVKTVEDLKKVAESTFSLEQLKEVLGSLSTDNLTKVADNLLAALKDQQGIVKGLQDRIASLGIAQALKAGELKNQLQSALSLVDELKGKLSSVVASLTEKGLDVSKYTEMLAG